MNLHEFDVIAASATIRTSLRRPSFLKRFDVGVGQPFNDPPLDELKRQRALFALEIALEDLSDETVVGRKSTGI